MLLLIGGQANLPEEGESMHQRRLDCAGAETKDALSTWDCDCIFVMKAEKVREV
jgi:hypothetical protein